MTVRRRARYLRLRDRGRRRDRKAPPNDGWLLTEVASLADITPRAVRYYVTRGLLPAPAFRGTATRYGREHLVRLLVLRALQRDALPLVAIRRRLAELSSEDREALALAAANAAPNASALLVALGAPADSERATRGSASMGARSGAEIGGAGDPSWRRFAPLPGLELLVADDASPLVHDVVKKIRAYCGASAEVASSSAIAHEHVDLLTSTRSRP